MQTLDAGLMTALSPADGQTLSFCPNINNIGVLFIVPCFPAVSSVQVHCRRNGSHHKLGSASIINFPRVPASTSTTSNYYTRGSAQLCCPLSSVNNRMLLLDKILRSRARLRRSDTYHCVNCWLLEFLHYLAVGICWYLRCHLGEN